MKYHEAIDMILDGGRARTCIWTEHLWLSFDESGTLCGYSKDGDLLIYGATTNKVDITRTDWIVEKNGVVYEERPNGTIFVKDRITGQGEPAEIPDGSQGWPEIKIPFIADEVNEEWLEKKMLCFFRRHAFINPMSSVFYRPLIQPNNCNNTECLFCLPEETSEKCRKMIKETLEKRGVIPKTDHSLDVQKIEKDILADTELSMQYCAENDARNDSMPCLAKNMFSDTADDHIEQPREKVTFSQMFCLITSFAEDYYMARNQGAHGGLMQFIMESSKAQELLQQKIAYLVSLQDN